MGQRPEVRIVGQAPEEEKQKARHEIAKNFGGEHFLDLPEKLALKMEEQEKRKDELDSDLIGVANTITNELLEKLGPQSFDVPERNIHILPSEFYNSLHKDSPSAVIKARQAIIVNSWLKEQGPRLYAKALLHEIAHLKGYYAEELVEESGDNGKGYQRKHYRVGFMIYTRRKKGSTHVQKHVSFRGLNEAVTSLLEREFSEELLSRAVHPTVRAWQDKWHSDEFQKLIGRLAKENSLRPEEIDYVYENKEDLQKSKDIIGQGYIPQMRVLEYIIKETAQEVEKNEDDIKNLFYKAYFDGNILTTARLVERTFGKGSFRFLGNMDKDDDSASRVLDYLKKQRRLMIRR